MRNKIFEAMVSGRKVRITKEGREWWDKQNLGQWFTVLSIHADDTAKLCGINHDIFENLDFKYITF